MRRISLPQTLSPATLEPLLESISDAGDSVLVLDGACRGMDLEVFLEADARPHLLQFADLVHSIRTSPCATIAVVDGAAIGGGVGIAGACDVVIATPGATFALPEVLFGLLPGVVVPALSHRMRPHAIHLLAALGTAHDAEWARSVGLVDEISADSERSVGRWARSLARADRRRLLELREWTTIAPTLELHAALLRGAQRTARAGSDPRVRELARAFVQEGEAPWLR